MKPLYTESEYLQAKSRDLLKCQCYVCNKPFFKQKRAINKILNNVYGHTGMYCSPKCRSNDNTSKWTVTCLCCAQSFQKRFCQIRKYPNHFCSRSCSATYNNKHKKHGTKRSKLEAWLEKQLTSLYPNLEIHFNRKDAINSELDIYFPSLKLAFELNGIFHYEPIFGEAKLNQIENNDQRKFQACLEQGIELCIIDTSSQKYFKEKSSKKYLQIISSILNERLTS